MLGQNGKHLGWEMIIQLYIVVPFADAETKTGIWAVGERKIDFHKQPYEAARCTAAFAATELRDHLLAAHPEQDIVFACEPQANSSSFTVELQVGDHGSRNTSFAFEPLENGLRILAEGRTGLLYGIYEFLRLQGWRWYAPGRHGEVLAGQAEQVVFPKGAKKYSPSMSQGSGFDFEYVSMESHDLLLWMARNRLNVCGHRPATAAFAQKLGMLFKVGGHIFEGKAAKTFRLRHGVRNELLPFSKSSARHHRFLPVLLG